MVGHNPVTDMDYWAEEVAYNKKTLLYVGGLDEKVTEDVLYNAFIPFGEIVNLQIPKEEHQAKHRGFGFVEFADPEDAQHALDNMHESELFGRVLKVSFAKPTALRTRAVWDQADEWYQKMQASQQQKEQAQKKQEEKKS